MYSAAIAQGMDSTAIVGVVGVAGTLLAALGAPTLAARHARASRLRDERVLLYVDALKHCADLRFRYLTDHHAGRPPGGVVTPPPQDEVTSRMTLIAHSAVLSAWRNLVAAERSLDAWATFVYSGDPDEEAPRSVTDPLNAAIVSLEGVCQTAVGNRD